MPAPFQLLAAHPALDFVNTLDNRFAATGPRELLIDYADLLAFLEQSGVLDARRISLLGRKTDTAAARKALQRAHEMREALASVFYAIAQKRKPSLAPLKRLERSVAEAQRHRELVWKRLASGDEEIARALWDWKPLEADVRLPVWAIARSAAELLTSSAVNHVHECANQTCHWLFLDTSKNHSRRWCDMTICGNRMKARRFQARQ